MLKSNGHGTPMLLLAIAIDVKEDLLTFVMRVERMELKSVIPGERKPGTGVDRTLIHGLLALPPAERVRMMVQSARNVMALSERIRKR